MAVVCGLSETKRVAKYTQPQDWTADVHHGFGFVGVVRGLSGSILLNALLARRLVEILRRSLHPLRWVPNRAFDGGLAAWAIVRGFQRGVSREGKP